MEPVKLPSIDCWILDEVETDFLTIWELVSVLHQRQTNLSVSDILIQVRERLSHLYSLNYLTFYRGIKFNGDEHIIEVNITDDFVLEQSEDWKSASEDQVKMYITDLGRKMYLNTCRPEDFIS